MKFVTLYLLLICFLFAGCFASEQTSFPENTTPDEDEVKTDNNTSEKNNLSDLLVLNLSDSYSASNNNIPNEFRGIKKQKEVEVDLTKGYRVQIYSGENVLDADTVASTFRAWSDTTIAGYQAETYTFFKTPYYRVHIGDFHDRERAFNFSLMVKRIFRDAWVVYDTVDPFSVPQDTVKISFIDS